MAKKDKLQHVNKWNKANIIQKGNLFAEGGKPTSTLNTPDDSGGWDSNTSSWGTDGYYSTLDIPSQDSLPPVSVYAPKLDSKVSNGNLAQFAGMEEALKNGALPVPQNANQKLNIIQAGSKMANSAITGIGDALSARYANNIVSNKGVQAGFDTARHIASSIGGPAGAGANLLATVGQGLYTLIASYKENKKNVEAIKSGIANRKQLLII